MAKVNYFSYETGSWVAGEGTDPAYDLLVLLPPDYSATGAAWPWVLECHGAGVTSHYYDISGNGSDYGGYHISEAWLAQGYVFVAAYQTHVRRWGNDATLGGVANSHAYAVANFNLQATGIVGGCSMGGLPGLLTLLAHPEWFRAGAFLHAVCSLDAMHTPEAGNSNYQAEINTSYACTNETYDAATAGHHPEDSWAVIGAAGLPLAFWHGTSDTTVNIAQPNALAAGVNAVLSGLVTVYAISGADHGNYIDTDAYAAAIPAFLAEIGPWEYDLELLSVASSEEAASVFGNIDTLGRRLVT